MSATDKLLNFAVENQIRFTRLANSKVKELDKLLEENQSELRAYLVTLTYPLVTATLDAKVARILEKYHSAATQLVQEIADEIALYAAELEFDALSVSGKAVSDPGRIKILQQVRNQLFQGAVIAEWARQAFTDDRNRVMRTIRTEVSYGRSGKKVAQAVLEPRRRYGARSQSFRALALLTRSAVMHAVSAGRAAVWLVNSHLIRRVMWVSVLDSHTSDTCRFLSGKTFDVNEGPRPPGHLNCRSTMVPLLIGDKNPRKQNWFEWLEKQPSAVQIEALGPTRYRLWKEGGIKPDKFLDEDGEQITLPDLQAKMPAAFRRLRNDQPE